MISDEAKVHEVTKKLVGFYPGAVVRARMRNSGRPVKGTLVSSKGWFWKVKTDDGREEYYFEHELEHVL